MSIIVRKRKLKSGDTTFYMDIYTGDNRRTETIHNVRLTPTTSAKERKVLLEAVETIRSKRQIELFNDENGFKKNVRSKEDFIEYFKAKRDTKNPKTREVWNNVLNYLINYTGGKVRFKSIDKDWIEGFIAFLQASLAPNSVLTYYQKVTSALNDAVKEEILMRNPAHLVKSPSKIEAEKGFLTANEINQVLSTPFYDDEVKRAFLFSTQTGLRISDIKNLKWSDISRDKDNSLRLTLRQKKTTVINYLPLNESAIKLMGQKGKEDEKVFKLSEHTTSINRTFKKLFKKTKIKKKISFHCARHTNATLLIEAGTDVYTVSKLLGHKDIKSTQVYAKIVDQKKIDAVKNLPKINF